MQKDNMKVQIKVFSTKQIILILATQYPVRKK